MKRLHVIGQRRRATPQSPLQPADLPDARLHAARNGMGPNALLTMADAAVYLCYHGERCASERCRCADICRQFLHSQGVPLSRRGRVCLVRQRHLDEVVALPRGARWIDMHGRALTLTVARR